MQILSNSEVLKLYFSQYQGPILIFHHLPLVDQSCTRHFRRTIFDFSHHFQKNQQKFFQNTYATVMTKKREIATVI